MKESFGLPEGEHDPSEQLNQQMASEPGLRAILAWPDGTIEASKDLAKKTWSAMHSSPAELVFDRVLAEVFPGLKEPEMEDKIQRMHECIVALAHHDEPLMTQGITPDQFKRFAERYLEEKMKGNRDRRSEFRDPSASDL